MPKQIDDGTVEEQKGKFTRRRFLGSAGLTAVAAVAESRIVGAATAAAEAAEADKSSKLHGPDAVSITLNINGEAKTLIGRAPHHAARCIAKSPGHHRSEKSLRPRHLRRLHGDERRPHDLCLHGAGDRFAREQNHHDRRARHAR